jgi:hypothetical protein
MLRRICCRNILRKWFESPNELIFWAYAFFSKLFFIEFLNNFLFYIRIHWFAKFGHFFYFKISQMKDKFTKANFSVSLLQFIVNKFSNLLLKIIGNVLILRNTLGTRRGSGICDNTLHYKGNFLRYNRGEESQEKRKGLMGITSDIFCP